MNKKSVGSKEFAEKLVKNIRRRASRKYSTEEKIRIVLSSSPSVGQYLA
jgi:transposase-like protein